MKNLIEMYKQYSTTQIHLENRRQSIVNWMFGILSLFLTALLRLEQSSPLIFLTSIMIIAISTTAIFYLRYIKAIIKSKYKVIDCLEKKLGHNLNQQEWKEFKKRKVTGANYEMVLFHLIIIFVILIIIIFKYKCLF